VPRYRFSDFIVSPRRRVVVRNGRELPLIPRYFDLLLFLIQRRNEAVHRRDIFDRVWSDVIVSDSALSQAIRTLRRTLGDDSREPRFIRTVSRHGYRFVFPEVLEEEDNDTWPSSETSRPSSAVGGARPDPFEPLLDRVSRVARGANDEEDQREAAELLHTLGTSEALTRLGTRPGHAFARALLRDTRWDSPEADHVPVLAGPAPMGVARALIALRLRRAVRMVALRWAGASLGGGVAGVTAGALGGLVLAVAPESSAPMAVVPVLAVIGGGCGAIGGAGVGAGLSVAEAIARSRRGIALVAGAALGGAIVGCAVQWIGRSRWRRGGSRYRRSCRTRLRDCDSDRRRWAGCPTWPQTTCCRRDHRRVVRPRCTFAHSCRTAARRRHLARDRSSCARVAGDAYPAGPLDW
jgi:DNA-binding winged helix-turn-helix (wHTH) protein